MEQTWRNCASTGVIGLIHPEGHFNDPKAGALRSATYGRLRRHFQLVNEMKLFEDIGNVVSYGIHIYGSPRSPQFLQICSLISPSTADGSIAGATDGEIPGIQYPWGGWDFRPHSSRVTVVDLAVLADWCDLFDPPGTQQDEARLLRPLTREHVQIISSLARRQPRLSDLGYRWTRCFDEDKARKDGYIEWRTEYPVRWEDVVYQGPHFTVATPFAKQPNEHCRTKQDYSLWDLETLPPTPIPRTNHHVLARQTPTRQGYRRGGRARLLTSGGWPGGG